MANPPITIGPFANVPAPGSPIRSDWPQAISNFVVDPLHDQFLHVNPVGLDDSTNGGATWVDWITVGNLTVPAGALRVFVTVAAHGISEATAFNNQFFVRVKIGSVTGVGTQMPSSTTAIRFGTTWVDRLVLTAGVKAVSIETLRQTGTGQLRADALSDFQILAHFAP